MDKFEASNGARFSEKENGTLVFNGGTLVFNGGTLDYPFELSPGVVYGLREFFQHERDEELGRWRWPDNPDYVVYLDSGDAVVVDETDPRKSPDRISRRFCEDPLGTLGWGEFAARAYFEAHPERQPWEEAKEGEVWIVTPSKALTYGERVEYPAIFQAGRFRDHGGSWEARDLTAARRIWPESN